MYPDFDWPLREGIGASRFDADILLVGTSAGGARAKAVIAWNPQTLDVRSGQVAAGEGFEYWLLKFDGVSGNQDDHVKNIAFLMDKQGEWRLAPAFDLTYSDNPSGAWTAAHQMTINGKRDDVTVADFEACAKVALMKRGRTGKILDEVLAAVRRWREFSEVAGLSEVWGDQIKRTHRLAIAKR